MLTLQPAPLDETLTTWLHRLREGDSEALDRVLPVVYDELRQLARAHLRRENAGHTLETTALVHEAYLRLSHREALKPEDRRHFFAIAAQAMRHVLRDWIIAKAWLRKEIVGQLSSLDVS